jgi:hypothetical protein
MYTISTIRFLQEIASPREYPAFIYWANVVGGPLTACAIAYMPICMAIDLLSCYFIEYVVILFESWRQEFEDYDRINSSIPPALESEENK